MSKVLDLIGNRNHDILPIQISDKSFFNRESELNKLKINNFFESITAFESVDRSFKSEIIHRQNKRFFSPFNISLVTGYRNRSEGANTDTMKKILKSRTRGRMLILIIRMARATQYAILVKDVKKLDDNKYQLSIYDSDFPIWDEKIIFDKNAFYAKDVDFDHLNDPVGVFIRDEDDMDAIQKANFEYYSKLCKKKH